MSDYVAEKIRYYRKAKLWTQEQLAEACDGISLMSIRRYETKGEGNHDPKTDDLRKIAKALGVDPSVFIEPFLSLSGVEVIADDGKTYLIDPTCEGITKDGEEIFLAGYRGDDLQSYRIKDAPETRIDIALDKLNVKGKTIAADRVEELTEIPRYKK